MRLMNITGAATRAALRNVGRALHRGALRRGALPSGALRRDAFRGALRRGALRGALRRGALRGALLTLAVAAVARAAPDPAVVIGKLARDPPATIAFAEARFSPLLAEPVVVSGALGFLGDGRFDRVVDSPYRERTEIRGESVSVAREGERRRTFALKRAPELGGLLAGLLALLSGDAAAVAREFSVVTHGTESRWALELVPLDDDKRRRLERMLVGGANDELRCIAVLTADGGASVMLLGENATRDLAARQTLDALMPRCRAE